MKKLITILLALCFVAPVFAGNVRMIDNDAWLTHMAEMQTLRQEILSLLTKSSRTFEDRDRLSVLQSEFAHRKANWDNYLEKVARGEIQPQPKKITEKHVHSSACNHGTKTRKYKKHCKTADCSHGKKMYRLNKKCKAADCCGVKGCKCNGKCDSECKKADCGHGKKAHKCSKLSKTADCCGVKGCKSNKKCGSEYKKADCGHGKKTLKESKTASACCSGKPASECCTGGKGHKDGKKCGGC